MKKTKLLFISILLFNLFTIEAQDQLKRANTYFDRAFYTDAIPLFEEIAKTNKSSAVIKNLADSYYNTYQMQQAAKWYSYLTSIYSNTLDEDYYFKYSEALKATGEYQKAFDILTDYYKSQNSVDKVAQLKSDFNYLENIKAIGNRFDIENLALNTEYSEFGAAQLGNYLVFSAANKKAKKVYRWNNQQYLDLYKHDLNKLNIGDSISEDFSSTINTKMHEGTFTMTKDGKTIYFTRNNFSNGKKKTDAKKVSNLKIYRATLVDNAWTDIQELSFNSNEFSNEHPALSHDENTLFFASDRPNGFGSFDIYKVEIQENDFYSDPENLGNLINTEKKEQFPFMDENDNLYFSSNGHPGFGLLDVFISNQENNEFQKPDNVGLPLNSSYDDFSYYLNDNNGYFSSNRPEGKGSDDIYSFTITKPLVIEDCQQFISGTVTDRTTKQILPNTTIVLLDSNNNTLKSIVTADDASFKFNVDCELPYRIEAKKEGYEANFKLVRTTKERKATIDASLDLFATAEKEKAELLVLQKKQEEERIKATIALEEKLLKEKLAAEELVLREKQNKEKAEKEKVQNIEKAIKTDDAIVKEKNRTIIKTQAINFDYSMWYLRRETRERLETVIKTMTSNPQMTIEIGTHTDRRGNNAYNKELSQKRANSVKEYLVENGIASNRIIAKGYGETKPVVECATDDSCSEEDHELNRRCEFVIVKWD